MKKITEIINECNKSELKKISEVINKRLDFLNYLTKKNYLIPKIFHDKMTSFSSDKNYDGKNCFDDYNEIWCSVIIDFGKQFEIHVSYMIYRKHDWNSTSASITLRKRVEKNNKLVWKECEIRHNTKGHWSSGLNKKHIMKIEKNALEILDLSQLDQNTYNMNMLGLFLNNIIAYTQTKSGDDCDVHEEAIIDCHDVNDLNSKKSLKENNYLIFAKESGNIEPNQIIVFEYVDF